MKTYIKALIAGSTCLLIPLSATAQQELNSSSDYQFPEFIILDIAVLPEPAHYSVPSISRRYVGTGLDIKLTIDANGHPSGVQLVRPLASYSDIHLMSFASQMRDLIAEWEFEPAEDAQGIAIPVKVLIPIKVVDKAGTRTAEFAILLDQTAKFKPRG